MISEKIGVRRNGKWQNHKSYCHYDYYKPQHSKGTVIVETLVIFAAVLCPQVSWRWRSSSAAQGSILTSWTCSARWWTSPTSWKSSSKVSGRKPWTELNSQRAGSCWEESTWFSRWIQRWGNSACACWRAESLLRLHRMNWTNMTVQPDADLSAAQWVKGICSQPFRPVVSHFLYNFG